jgi:serine phosphatase RsbU (regulator of sigma subunit)/ActR/RegA family two-component response regulator
MLKDNVFSTEKRPKILAVEQDPASVRIIAGVCKELDFNLYLASDPASAMNRINQKFFHVILCNPALTGGFSADFIGNIRSHRGYQKTPILMLTEEKNIEKISLYLEEGADGYIHKPFIADVLSAHLNLFIRRQAYQGVNTKEYLRKGLSREKGSILLCCSSPAILDIPPKAIETRVIPVASEEQLFKELHSENVWIVLVGTDAKWALPLVGKIKNQEPFNVQVILLRSNNVLEAEVVDFFNNGGDDIMSVRKPVFIIARQINSRIERETYYKQKYISALQEAALKLPVRSEKKMTFKWEKWSFEALHYPHEDIPGGDFYEVISLPGDKRFIILGDVMGNKWGAWFFSLAYLAYIRSILRSLATGRKDVRPGSFLHSLNDAVFRDFKLSEVFTTLTVIQLRDSSPELEIASAGGLPLFIKRAKEKRVEQIRPKGKLLGVEENVVYENVHINLSEEDSLVLLTDGYTETEEQGGLSGISAVQSYLERSADITAGGIDESVSVCFDSGFLDDRTVIVLRKT